MIPDIFTAFSCGATVSVSSLDVFSYAASEESSFQSASYASDLSECHRLFANVETPLFPCSFSFRAASPVFRSPRDLSEDNETSILFSALRGKGLPLSCQTDREAVEWCMADLLEHNDDPSVSCLISWLSEIKTSGNKTACRLTLLADLADPVSSGITLALLPFLRKYFSTGSVFLTLLAVAETRSPLPDSFFPTLSASLNALDSRGLIRGSKDQSFGGADAMWLLSLPSSMTESSDSGKVISLGISRVLASVCSGETMPLPGFHTVEADGTFSVSSLGNQATSFSGFMQTASWLVLDILPSLRGYLSHTGRFRSLAINSRNNLYRHLFSGVREEDVLTDLIRIESVLKHILSDVLLFIRSVPSSFRLSPENISLWQQAVNACGRYITVASELDISSDEAKESGLDCVKPVHRVSMADTEEEKAIRRLQEIEKQLESEKCIRDEILSSLGGYRSVQVKLDCMARCSSALADARKKAENTSPEEDHLTLLKRNRRIRLLEAAVCRCKSELDSSTLTSAVSALPGTKLISADPYAFSALTSEACHMLEQVLSVSAPEAVTHVAGLFPGVPDPDIKSRYKALFSLCRVDVPASPVPFLISKAASVCFDEVSTFSFISRNEMPPVPLLPDLFSETPFQYLHDIISRIPGNPEPFSESASLRGILAMLILRQYRRRLSGEASVSCIRCSSPLSAVVRYWLNTYRSDSVFILSLVFNEDSFPFALVLPGRMIIPAYITAAHATLVPSFVTWYDRNNNVFTDPCESIGEGDRKLLLDRLVSLQDNLSEKESPLYRFVSDFIQDLSAEHVHFRTDEDFRTRLKAACGLSTLPAYSSSLSRICSFYEHFLPDDPILSALSGKPDFPASACSDVPDEILYVYRGIPFAREDSRFLLDSPHSSGEDYTLSRLKAECTVLSESSDDFRDALLLNLQNLLAKYPEAQDDPISSAMDILSETEKPVEHREPVFTWPWDAKSPSLHTILRESLGEKLSLAALQPFSDLLAVFPARGGEVIGDTLFSSLCSIPPRILNETLPESEAPASDAALPPLSPEFGRALCTLPEGKTLLHPELLRFERIHDEAVPSDSFRVTLTLDGAFPIHLIRTFSQDEVLYLYAHDIPTVALWPSVPFSSQQWKTWYLYAHIQPDYSVGYLRENGTFADIPDVSDERCVAVLSAFPSCLSFSSGGRGIGILPNVLPEPLLPDTEPTDICIDFGSSGTSVVFSSGRHRKPMQGPVMVRTLLNNPAVSRDLLRREFLPAVPVSALLPTVSRIFRNVPGAAPVPFTDGIVLMSSTLEDLLTTPSEAVYTSLKWEEEKGRSGFLCLHQIMLMAALQARFDGSPSISWRFSIPDEMAREGRESMMRLFLSLAEKVHRESGFEIPPEGLPVAFASESSALGAYFRYCAPDDTRGGFMVLDLGACTADISLFLRGREQAVRTCQIPLGIHYMLLPSLMKDPEMLFRDFSFCPDESFRRDLSLLTRALSAARTNPVSLRRARVALDHFIADHLPQLLNVSFQAASAGCPARSSALLLLHFSYLMMLSGLVLLQLASDPNKNDFLPEQMSLCISGRGAILLEALPSSLKTSLWHFLTMFRNKRVSSLSLLFSAEKKMEIPVGLSLLQDIYHMLPPAATVPAAVSVRPAELLPEFLIRFRKEFPVSSEMLFSGFFTNDFYHPFTAYGESLVSASIDQSFPPAETPRPYNSLSAWIGNLLDLI